MISTGSFSTFLSIQAAGPTTHTTIPATQLALEPVLGPLPAYQVHVQAALTERTNRQARLVSRDNKVNLVAIMLTPTIPTITKAIKVTKATKGIPAARVIIRRKARCRPTGLGQE